MLATACGADTDRYRMEEGALNIEQVLMKCTPDLMRIEGVQGVGQALCDSAPCIRVYVLDAAAEARVPLRIDGIPVSTVITGVIRGANDHETPPR